MKKTGTCPKCGGKEIAHFVDVSSGKNPSDVLGFNFSLDKNGPEIIIEAHVCKKCGYIELYVPEIHLKSL